MPVMHDQPIPCPAALADVSIAKENRIAMTAKATARGGLSRVTPATQSRAKEWVARAAPARTDWAEPVSRFPDRIPDQKRHYHQQPVKRLQINHLRAANWPYVIGRRSDEPRMLLII